MDLHPGPVGGELVQGHAPFLDDQDGLVAFGGQGDLDDMLVRLVRSLFVTSSRRGGSHASTRPVPSHPLAKARAELAAEAEVALYLAVPAGQTARDP